MADDVTFIERDEMDGHNPAIVITRGGRALTWDEVTRLVQILNSPEVSAAILAAWRDNTPKPQPTPEPIMIVKAKFHCEQVTRTEWGAEVPKFRAVYTGTPEDNSYSQATPSASMELTVTNPAVHGFFVPGKEYYLQITQVDAAEQATGSGQE